MYDDLRVLYLDLNSFFASVEQQENPYLMGKPVAVVPSMTDYTCAIAASYEAKAYGVKTGTLIHEAKRLCPHLKIVLARHDIYRDYHDKVVAAMNAHLFVDPVRDAHSIDEFAARLIGSEQKLENATAIARGIKATMARDIGEGVKCSIGLAPNTFLSKTASDMQKPDGLVALRPQDLPGPLFDLKLQDLCGIGLNMARRFHHAGVTSVRQLWEMSPKQARKIWGGVGGERFWYSLHGMEIDALPTRPCMVGHSRVLDPVMRPPGVAYSMAQRLTVKAATRLRRQGHYAANFSLSVRTTDGERWYGQTDFAAARDNFTFLEALRTLWAVMLAELQPMRLKKVSVVCGHLTQETVMTGDLFQVSDPSVRKRRQVREDLSVAMDVLNRKHGRDTVHIGALPTAESGYVGTKIAFSRIPDREEFWE